MKLAENIVMLTVDRFHPVLVWDAKNLVLIDTCYTHNIDELSAAIAETGHYLKDLTHIILTHQDGDHVGGANAIRKIAPNVKVMAHTDEAKYIDGRELPVKLQARLKERDSMTAEQQEELDNYYNAVKKNPTAIDIQVSDGQVLPICGGIEIIHTPGHTPGHICPYFRTNKIVVLGDAANIQHGEIVDFFPQYIQDMDLAKQSIEKIKSYDLAGAAAYHTGFLQIK